MNAKGFFVLCLVAMLVVVAVQPTEGGAPNNKGQQRAAEVRQNLNKDKGSKSATEAPTKAPTTSPAGTDAPTTTENW